ncbi:MAG: DUF302 domain-containing protein [Pseudomonadota bacterium]
MRIVLTVALMVWAGMAMATPLTERAGWAVMPTSKTYDALVEATLASVKANKMGVVTQAGPTGMAAQRGFTIPGNRVIGVYRNDFAVSVIGLSVAAMIEAPIRMYVTENADGTATLSYKTPSFVYAPYLEEGGAELEAIAAELDTIFASIARTAVE